MQTRYFRILWAALVFGHAACRADSQPLAIDTSATTLEVSVHSPPDSFVGHVTAFDVLVSYDPVLHRPDKADVVFNFSNLKTGKRGRDEKMLSWMDAAHFPSGHFVLNALKDDGGGNLVASGELAIHGVTQPIQFPVRIQDAAGRLTLDGQVRLDTRTFDLPVIRMLAMLKVDPFVTVKFHLEGTHD